MKSSEVLKQMKSIREEWHRNDFQLTKEKKHQYAELLKLRHARVAEIKSGATE